MDEIESSINRIGRFPSVEKGLKLHRYWSSHEFNETCPSIWKFVYSIFHI